MSTQAYSYIRFSTPEQKKGDSYRRQEEQTLRYCKEYGLELDKKLTFRDLGLSAFHGAHRKRGELGHFIELVEQGKVQAGSVLIVENLDRLSRENVMDAFDQFRSLLRKGITIVTLMDRMEYSQESIEANWTQLIISITYMAKAHRESKDKSDRLKEAWQNKRKIIDARKLTARAPYWVTLSKDRSHFERNEPACQAIEIIFRLKLEGYGPNKIAVKLNNEMPDVWKPPHLKKRISGGWRGSYISKILYSRAVIGEYTPCTKVNGKRIPGFPIEDYFPPAISEELFYLVQNQMKENAKIRGNAGGITGKHGNLFRHLVKCGLCGQPLHLIDKGTLPKGGVYLQCDAVRRKLPDISCTAKLIRYEEFESTFFERFDEECSKIASEILPNHSELAVRKGALQTRLIANKEKQQSLNESNENLLDHIERRATKATKEALERRLRRNMNILNDLEKEHIIITKELGELSTIEKDWTENAHQIKSLRELLTSASESQEQANIRLRINNELKKMFEWIKVYPLQEPFVKYVEVEPGVVQIMHSRYIDRITYKLKDLPLPHGLKSHGIIPLKTFVDTKDKSLKELLK